MVPKVGEKVLLAAFATHRADVERTLLSLTDDELADRRFLHSFRVLASHDFEHLPSVQERLALVFLANLPAEAFEERLPDKWPIKEILIHLTGRAPDLGAGNHPVGAWRSDPSAAAPGAPQQLASAASQEAWHPSPSIRSGGCFFCAMEVDSLRKSLDLRADRAIMSICDRNTAV